MVSQAEQAPAGARKPAVVLASSSTLLRLTGRQARLPSSSSSSPPLVCPTRRLARPSGQTQALDLTKREQSWRASAPAAGGSYLSSPSWFRRRAASCWLRTASGERQKRRNAYLTGSERASGNLQAPLARPSACGLASAAKGKRKAGRFSRPAAC